MKDNVVRFRQLWRCQNGHDRWFYLVVHADSQDTKLKETWGERTCDCPTFAIGEGYAPYGEVQLYAGIRDKTLKRIYRGDILLVPEHYEGDMGMSQDYQQVVFDECKFYLSSELHEYTDLWDAIENYGARVAGNVDQNSELLNEGKQQLEAPHDK